MPDFAVSTTFTGKDRVSAAFKRMGSSAGVFGDKATRAFRKASKEGSAFGGITKSILAASAIQRGLGLVEQGVSGVIQQFVGFDDAVTAATVRFKDIGPEASNFAEQLDKIKMAARGAGQATEFNAVQAAEALDFMARAGFTSTEAMAGLRSMIDLATASGEDFAQVADFSTDLLGSFGLAARDSAQKIANLNRLNNVLVGTANAANVKIEDMFETLKIAAPIGKEYGASLEQMAAMTAILGGAGIKGSQGATAMKNIFTRLSAPTKDVTRGLEKLGIAQQDLIDLETNRLKDPITAFKLIGDRLKDVAQPERVGILKDIFGAFAIAGGANLARAIEDTAEFETRLENVGDISRKTADIMRMSLGNRIKSLASAATEAGFKFLSAFDGDGRDAITRLTIAVRNFDMQPIIDFAVKTVDVFKKMVAVIREHPAAIKAIVAGFLAFGVAVKAMAIANVVAGFIQFVNVLRAASAGQWLLNAALAANPIGAVIVGVAALAAGLVYLAAKYPPIKEAIFSVFNAFRPLLDLFMLFTDFIGGVFSDELDRSAKGMEGWVQVMTIALKGVAGAIEAILTPLRGAVKLMELVKKFGVKGVVDIVRGKTPESLEPDAETSVVDQVMGAAPPVATGEELREELRKSLTIPVFYDAPDEPTQLVAPVVETPEVAVNRVETVVSPQMDGAGMSVPIAEPPPLSAPVLEPPKLLAPTVEAPEVAMDRVETVVIQQATGPDRVGGISTPDETPKAPEVIPPNRQEVQARQLTEFKARLDIAGAPDGSTLEQETTGAAPIDMNLLGAQ